MTDKFFSVTVRLSKTNGLASRYWPTRWRCYRAAARRVGTVIIVYWTLLGDVVPRQARHHSRLTVLGVVHGRRLLAGDQLVQHGRRWEVHV